MTGFRPVHVMMPGLACIATQLPVSAITGMEFQHRRFRTNLGLARRSHSAAEQAGAEAVLLHAAVASRAPRAGPVDQRRPDIGRRHRPGSGGRAAARPVPAQGGAGDALPNAARRWQAGHHHSDPGRPVRHAQPPAAAERPFGAGAGAEPDRRGVTGGHGGVLRRPSAAGGGDQLGRPPGGGDAARAHRFARSPRRAWATGRAFPFRLPRTSWPTPLASPPCTSTGCCRSSAVAAC